MKVMRIVKFLGMWAGVWVAAIALVVAGFGLYNRVGLEWIERIAAVVGCAVMVFITGLFAWILSED